jgi:uncharacterized repeat protein (TIGR01451 family)
MALLSLFFWASGATAQVLPCTKTFEPGLILAAMSWHDPANWNPVGVPGPTDVACILENGDYDIDVTLPVTVAGLEINVAMGKVKTKILGTDFTVNGPARLDGVAKLKVNDGAVLRTDGGGIIDVYSKLVVGSGTVAIDVELYGHLTFEGTGMVTGNLVTYPGSVIELEEGAASGHLSIANGFANNGMIHLGDAAPQSLTVMSGALVNTAGAMISVTPDGGPPAGVPELKAELDNRGMFEVDGLDLLVTKDGSQHVNQAGGTIEVTDAELEIDLSGVLDVPSNFTNYGTTMVAGGGSIRVRGTTGKRWDGMALLSWVNHGTIDFVSGGVLEFVGTSFDNRPGGLVGGVGTLDIDQATGVVFDGILSPGWSPGIFDVEGSLSLGSSASFEIEIGGLMPGVNRDRIDLSGSLGAAGTLDVDLIDPFVPSAGEVFEIITYAGLTGWFDAINLPALPGLLVWNPVPGPSALNLEVVCAGTQLGVGAAPDRDPVSVGYELVYSATVTNRSSVGATDVVVSNLLPPSLSFRPDLSSPECTLIGDTVECMTASLPAQGSWNVLIGADAVIAGQIDSTMSVGSWECDTDPSDNASTATVQAVLAGPCDADSDFSVDSDDLEPAVGHIYGELAPGNPDCRLADGITADDLSAIIEAAQ